MFRVPRLSRLWLTLLFQHLSQPQPTLSDDMALFSPPIVRSASAILDRSLLSKTIPVAAARIFNNKNISNCRAKLQKSKEMLEIERLTNVRPDPDQALASKGGKCMLLKPSINPSGTCALKIRRKNLTLADSTTWSSILQEAVKAEELGVIPYDLNLDYNYWTYCE